LEKFRLFGCLAKAIQIFDLSTKLGGLISLLFPEQAKLSDSPAASTPKLIFFDFKVINLSPTFLFAITKLFKSRILRLHLLIINVDPVQIN
jgi:hypothetical protein